MAISSPGIGSNLDVSGIIAKLMQVESQPLLALARKEATFQAKLSAFGSLSGALSSFQSSLATLNNPATFKALSATPSDASVISATASSKAVPGNYNVNVTQMAQAQTLSTAGLASTTATIGSGSAITLNFQFGTISGGKLADGRYVTDPDAVAPAATNTSFTQNPERASGSITIDNTNNSLQGIRDAINKADIGVSATIISDGSATPFRLVLSSTKTGAASGMKISVQGAETAISDLLAYDPTSTQNLTQTAAAQSTALTINGVAITSPTTTISEAIQDVTLSVAKTGTSTLAIARNTAGIQSGINALVKSYNELNATIKNVSVYDQATKQGGPLVGDSGVQSIQAQLRRTLSSAMGGTGNVKTLTDVGISFQKDGTMAFDASKLTKALTDGTTNVATLFSSMGSTTDSLVSFVSSTSATKAATSDVFVTSLATQGRAVGDTPLGLSTAINATNDEMTVTIDGVVATVKLLQKADYTRTELAAQVQSAINGASALSSAGIAVKVNVDANGLLSVVSNQYGSKSTVNVSGNSVATLFGTAAVQTGADIAGSIGGSPATGSGQFLTGAAGSNAEGLKVQVTGGAENVARGAVTFSQGYAFKLNQLLEGLIGSTGPLKSRTEGINRSIKDLDRTREAMSLRLAAVEKRYRAQFTALDTTISKMSTTSNFLTQQLAALTKSSQ